MTSFHHQPEAQHPKSLAIHKNAGRLPHLSAGPFGDLCLCLAKSRFPTAETGVGGDSVRSAHCLGDVRRVACYSRERFSLLFARRSQTARRGPGLTLEGALPLMVPGVSLGQRCTHEIALSDFHPALASITADITGIRGYSRIMSSRSIRIGRSVTGLGLFATKPIKRGVRIAAYRGRRITTEEADRREARGARYQFELNKRWTIDGSPRWNLARYINHSCRPNAKPVGRRGGAGGKRRTPRASAVYLRAVWSRSEESVGLWVRANNSQSRLSSKNWCLTFVSV